MLCGGERKSQKVVHIAPTALLFFAWRLAVVSFRIPMVIMLSPTTYFRASFKLTDAFNAYGVCGWAWARFVVLNRCVQILAMTSSLEHLFPDVTTNQILAKLIGEQESGASACSLRQNRSTSNYTLSARGTNENFSGKHSQILEGLPDPPPRSAFRGQTRSVLRHAQILRVLREKGVDRIQM